MDISNSPILLDSKQQRKHKGRILNLHDRDIKMINSGPLGSKRLITNKAIDLQEIYPDLSDEDAYKMSLGYYILNYGSN